MHMQALSLHTRHLAEQQAFYFTTLGFPLLAETADSFTMQAGTTRLRFQQGQHDVLYHLAFTIPRNTFLQAKSWLLVYCGVSGVSTLASAGMLSVIQNAPLDSGPT